MGHVSRTLRWAHRGSCGEVWTRRRSRREQQHPFTPLMQLEEVAPGVAFVSCFANVTAVATDDGLVLVDTGSAFAGATRARRAARAGRRDRCTPRSSPTATSTTCSASSSSRPRRRAGRPRAAGRSRTRRVPARFDRYRLTAGYNAASTSASSRLPAAVADRVPLPRRDLRAAARRSTSAASTLELHHARGETDDHTWVWVPARARAVHRRPVHLGRRPTRATRRRCSATRATGPSRCARWPRSAPRCCCPGHGLPIVGADRVRAGAHRHRRAARVAARPDARADERGRAARRDRAHRAGAGAPARAALPAARSTTSPSSSCATSGGSTAAGRTATRRTSSRRRRDAGARAGGAGRRRGGAGRARRGARGERATCAWPATSPSGRRARRPTTTAWRRRGARSTARAPRRRRR